MTNEGVSGMSKKKLSIIIQDDKGKQIFIKRISLPFHGGSEEFAGMAMDMNTDMLTVIAAYNMSIKEGRPFEETFQWLKKQGDNLVEKYKK